MSTLSTEDRGWGIIKNYHLLSRTEVEPFYKVVANGIAAFVPERRRVATGLVQEEAEALCAILNSGAGK